MSIFTSATRQYRTIVVAITTALFALLASGCDDFYSDSLPTPDIAQPTPANAQVGDPEILIEAAAREAMAALPGINLDDPQNILFEHETWTERNPGCYPTPPTITGAYLIPGYRLLMQHDGVFYEYNADQGVSTGALCESTFQIVPVEPAYSIVTPSESAEPDAATIHILRSEDDVAEFNSTHADTAQVGVNEIDFPLEVLVGGWVDASPNPEPARAYLSTEGTSIIIEVTVPEEFIEEANDDSSQIWVLVDTTDPNSTYEFVVLD